MKTETCPGPRVETQQEAQLIALYRRLSASQQKAVAQYFGMLRQSVQTPEKKNHEA